MRNRFLIIAAISVAVAGMDARAAPSQTSPIFAMNGGVGNPSVSSRIRPAKADGKLYDYCKKVIDDMQRGTSSGVSGDFIASDCIAIFIEASIATALAAGQPGQPGRSGGGGIGMPGGSGGAAGQPGQDGQGLPGLPGGKGGAAGGSNGGDTEEADVDVDLLDYCDAVLRQSRRANAAPVESPDYEIADCAAFFATFDMPAGKASGGGGGARRGSDGPSISGGRGGQGGAPGAGPGGGSGGAGGGGISGGSGGKGGAGGSGY
jgi:hypothetical protein